MDMVVSSSCWFLSVIACFYFLFLCFWSLPKSREAPVRFGLWEMDVWSVQLHTATGGGPDARERLARARQEVQEGSWGVICPSKQDETRSARRRWMAVPDVVVRIVLCLQMRLQTCLQMQGTCVKGDAGDAGATAALRCDGFVYVPDGGLGNGLAAREKQQELAPPEAGCASGLRPIREAARAFCW
ncbi:hypothetical protein CCMA1212_004448 [Trichoderma ghanense]|uniref:Uncharacterized protein n=1 Tax=Trichoderma ghanense TaxID=65468 RepID=A0ABY2H9I8_9HYPO